MIKKKKDISEAAKEDFEWMPERLAENSELTEGKGISCVRSYFDCVLSGELLTVFIAHVVTYMRS